MPRTALPSAWSVPRHHSQPVPTALVSVMVCFSTPSAYELGFSQVSSRARGAPPNSPNPPSNAYLGV